MQSLFRGRNVAIFCVVVLFVLVVGTASTMFAYHKGAEFPREISSVLAGKECLRTSKLHSSFDVIEGVNTSDRSIVATYHMPYPQMVAEMRTAANKLGFKEDKPFKDLPMEVSNFEGLNGQTLYVSRGYYEEGGRLTGLKEHSTVLFRRKATDFELRFDEIFHSGQYNEKMPEWVDQTGLGR